MMSKVSVIVPVYNAREFLTHCIQSLLNQTYKNIEILLIDDGSSDGSEKICDSFSEKDKRVITVHQRNAGVSAARNTGIEFARGEYIVFVDSDDWVEPEHIRQMMDKKNESDIVICDFKEEVQNGVSARQYHHFNQNKTIKSQNEVFEDFLKSQLYTYVVWDKLYSKKIIGNTRFEAQAYAEDSIFCREILAKCKKLQFVPQKSYHYRISMAGVTADGSRGEEICFGSLNLQIKTVELYENLGYNDLALNAQKNVETALYCYLKSAIKYEINNPYKSLEIVKIGQKIIQKRDKKIMFKITCLSLIYKLKLQCLLCRES